MRKVLVTGASGIVGYGILRSLKNCNCQLIGSTIYEVSPANFFADIVLTQPLTSDDNYIPWLINTIKKYNINMVIPGIEADMKRMNQSRKILENTGVFLLLNNEKLVTLCLDKWEFYQKLKSHNFQCVIKSSLKPKFDDFKTPFLLKPRCGFGSKGIVKIENEQTFNKYKADIGVNLMVQEYIGSDDEEYTVSGFFDAKSELKAFISMKRKLSKQGFTEIAEVVKVPELKNIVIELAKVLKPIGATNFQFRKHEEKWKLLEINPRISSSTSLKTAFGYNECQMSIDYFLDKKDVTQPEILSGKAIRYTEDYIFYDSDNI